MIRDHSRRAARNFATSSRTSLCAQKKKEIWRAMSSAFSPRSTHASTYAIPFARVNPTSCAAVAPASRMW